MATTTASEAKAETNKPEAKAKAEVKEKEAEKNQEHPKCKTHVLRVSIHCEGCKKKVNKILTKIQGVDTTNFDLRQQKVIVTGDVDAQTLIRKLEKNGKHAELWPESKAEKNDKKQSKAKNKENQQKQSDQESSAGGNNNHPSSGKVTVKVEATVQESSKNKEIENGGGTGKNVETNNGAVHVTKVNEVGSTSKAGGQVKESKPEVKQTDTSSANSQSPAGDKKVGGVESEGAVENSGAGGGGDGGGGKKKKKKGHKGNNVTFEGEHSGDAPAGTGSPIHGPHEANQGPYLYPTNNSSPHQHGYPYYQYHPPPPHYQTPPSYAVSYNTAHPRPYSSTSYYTEPTPYSYASMHPGTGNAYPPSDVDSYSSQPSDSFEMFSEENPNACSMM